MGLALWFYCWLSCSFHRVLGRSNSHNKAPRSEPQGWPSLSTFTHGQKELFKVTSNALGFTYKQKQNKMEKTKINKQTNKQKMGSMIFWQQKTGFLLRASSLLEGLSTQYFHTVFNCQVLSSNHLHLKTVQAFSPFSDNRVLPKPGICLSLFYQLQPMRTNF